MAPPQKAEQLEVNEADDGLVIYDPAHGMVHHLNESASVIFDLCDGMRDPDAIAQALAAAFALGAPPRDDAVGGLRDLAARHLILWDGDA